MNYTDVNGVSNSPVHHAYGYFAAVLPPYALFFEIAAKAERPVTFVDVLLENQLDGLRVLRVNHKVTHILIFLIHAACPFQLIAKRRPSAGVVALLGQLFDPGLDAHRGFDAFPGRLPVSYVVQQFVNMIIKTLLALHGAPYLNAVFHKPFDDKRSFIVLAAQAVKHENQQNIKPTLQGQLLDFLNSVPILGRFLKTGNAFLGKLLDNFPAGLSLDKLPAKLLLHGNIVFLHLPHRGNTVKAYNTL